MTPRVDDAVARRIAIIGGGPGGLFTAYQLQQRCGSLPAITLYESSGRLGGKVLSRRFEAAPVPYEAGAAELYNYSRVGEDPLRDLVARMGLHTKPMSGTAVVLDGQVLQDTEDICRVLGKRTEKALADFDRRAHRWSSPQEFYDSDWSESGDDPRNAVTFEDELSKVPDEAARRFLRTLVHSDLATEPHQTSAAYGLQNYLMNDPAYMTLYTIEGGIEQLVREVAARITATVRLNEPVLRVESADDGRLRVLSRSEGQERTAEFDFIVVALPNNYLPAIAWRGDSLADAMRRHHVHHDHPAHYLRVSVLFREAFTREQLRDSFVMLDCFEGCCLYDEASRNECGHYGVLGWLLAGNAAVTAGNWTDAQLIDAVLGSLPGELSTRARELFVEGHVHRWLGAVNGLPGGQPALSMSARHMPDPSQPHLFVVGDYLFDSTLNGVLDSADFVAEELAERMHEPAATESTAVLHTIAV